MAPQLLIVEISYCTSGNYHLALDLAILPTESEK